MDTAVHPEVLLAGGYAVLMLAASAGLEVLARHAAARTDRYRTAGFRYQPEHDLWICPRDQPLWPVEIDPEHRLVRYRARPTVCGACPSRPGCTDSPHGREVTRPVDNWPHSDAGRFHRAMAVLLTTVAVAYLAAAVVVHHRPLELVIEAGLLTLSGALLAHWARDLLHTPSAFPDHPTSRPTASPSPPGSPSPTGSPPSTGSTARPAGRRYWSDTRSAPSGADRAGRP